MLKQLYTWMIEKAALPQAERWLFLFSFMESSFFPIPPHPLLGLMCLARPDKALRFALICTLASVMGGLLGYAIGYFAYQTIGTALLQALGLSDSFPAAACYLREFGTKIILIKGATPIPFKLLTLTAGFIHMNLFDFLWASLLSRAFQFMLVGVLFWKFGAPIKSFIDTYLAWVSAGFILLVVGGFVAFSVLAGESGPTTGDRCAGMKAGGQSLARAAPVPSRSARLASFIFLRYN
jgi:membrane protein YqaA with SNARE-associated domain